MWKNKKKVKPKMESLKDNKGLSKEKIKMKKIETAFSEEALDGRYQFVKSLGMGAYGAVCQAKRLEDDEIVAIKKVLKIFANESQAKRLLRELALLRKLRGCEQIVGLHDILPPDNMNQFDSLIFVLEYIDTDLGKLFKSNQFWTQKHVPYILYQILLGLNYMHSAHICHRDLKPANLLMNSRCKVRICDFGLARSWIENETGKRPALLSKGRAVKNEQKRLSTGNSLKLQPMAREPTKHVVTRWYRPPEVILLEQKWDGMAAIDMWAVGCIFAEIMQMLKKNCENFKSRRALFPGGNCYPLSPHTAGKSKVHHQDQLQKIFDVLGTPTSQDIDGFESEAVKKYLRLYKNKDGADMSLRFPGSPAADIDLMKKCLEFNRHKRMTVSEALAHPALKNNRNKEREITTTPQVFVFEDVKMSISELRSAIVDEILLFNPKIANKYGLEPTKSKRNLQLIPRTITPLLMERESTIPEDVKITDTMRKGRGVYTSEEMDENWVDEEKLDDADKATKAVQSPSDQPEYANSVEEAAETLPARPLNLKNKQSSGMPLSGEPTSSPVPESQYGPNTPRDDNIPMPGMRRDITGEEQISSRPKPEMKNAASPINENVAKTPAAGAGGDNVQTKAHERKAHKSSRSCTTQ